MATERIDAIQLDITSKTTGDNIDKLITSLNELGSALDKLKSKSISVDVKNTGSVANSAATSVDKLNGSFATTAIKLTAIIALFRKLGSVISSSVANSATYIKSLNMFTLSMGEYADNASKYAETVSEALGIDPAEWIKTQGTFQTLVKGFGVVGDKAAYMSQQLTQLSYDYSSYFGITVEEAANKLRAAVSGRVEPIRKLGISPTQPELVDYAKNTANYGKQTFYINQQTGAIEANTVATSKNTAQKIGNYNQIKSNDKAILRYNYILEHSSQILGDYSRALNDPYNQLNIFKQQLNQTSRAFGNLFIPALNKVLPYLSAFAQLATEAFQALAQLFGFELPDMKERTSINTKDYDHVVKSTGKAKDNAKKMKDYMLGIDELNVFNPNTGAGAGGSGNKAKNPDLSGLKLRGYDFLGKAVENSIKKAKDMLKKLAEGFKKDPLLFTARILVEGAGKLGAKIWEWLLGMSPEQLKAEATKHGRTIGAEFWEQFKSAMAAKVGALGAGIWSIILGKSPDELKADAVTHGSDIGTEFFNQLADRIDGQAIWEAIWGTPTEFAKKASEAGQTVGEYFTNGLTTMLLKWSKTNPLFSAMYKMFTGTDLDSVIAAYEAKLNPKKQESTTPRGYVSYYQAKALSEAQNSKAKSEAQKKAGTIPAVDNSMNVANAKQAANTFINTYSNTLTSQKSKVQYSATEGVFNPTIKGITKNGKGAEDFKYVSYQDAKAYYSNFTSKETRQATFNAGSSASASTVSGLKSNLSDVIAAGANAGAGFIGGINNPKNTKDAVKAGAVLGANTLISIKKTLGIESPSKEFAKVGKWSVLGFTNSIDDNTQLVVDSVSAMGEKAISTMRKASALSNSVIMGGSVSVPTTSNAGYSVGAANEGAMSSLAGNIYQAVVSGISDANIGNGNSGDIKVIIDGKEVFKAVQTESRKRGVAVSNGAFSR